MATPVVVIKGVLRTQYPSITYPIVKPRTAMMVVSKGTVNSNVKSR